MSPKPVLKINSAQSAKGHSRTMSQTETKKCATKECANEILADSEFEICEVCRTIQMRNSIALGLDPAAPAALSIRRERVQQVITMMRQDEMVAFVQNVEYWYLEFQKVIKLHGIGNEKKKAFKSLAEQIDDARDANENDLSSKRVRQLRKAVDKRTDNLTKAAKKLGVDRATAEKFLNEEIDF